MTHSFFYVIWVQMCLLILDWPVKPHSRWWCHVQSFFLSLCCINKVASFSFTLLPVRTRHTTQYAHIKQLKSTTTDLHLCVTDYFITAPWLCGEGGVNTVETHTGDLSVCVCYGSSNWCHISRKSGENNEMLCKFTSVQPHCYWFVT